MTARLLFLLLLASALSPLPAKAQQRPTHVGARHFDIDLVPLDASLAEGNGRMVLGDVWEKTTVEEDICTDAQEAEVEAAMQACHAGFWARWDADSTIRASDERTNRFLKFCFGFDTCRKEFQKCDRYLGQCSRRRVVWNHYDRRDFALPCRPFDYLDWEDKRGRDDWDGGRWGRIRKVQYRGFVGDPNPIKGFFGYEGKPMVVVVKDEVRYADGSPVKIGSYFFADYKQGRIALTSFEEPQRAVKITLPYQYKHAAPWRHGWVNDLWVCERTFTEKELAALYKQWGLPLPDDEN